MIEGHSTPVAESPHEPLQKLTQKNIVKARKMRTAENIAEQRNHVNLPPLQVKRLKVKRYSSPEQVISELRAYGIT